MPKYLLQTPHMNCLGGGSGLGLFSLVPDSEREGSSNLGTFAGEPLAKMGVALRLGDSATVGRDWVSTLVMAEVDVEIAGFVAAEGLVMTSCCCCGCGCG